MELEEKAGRVRTVGSKTPARPLPSKITHFKIMFKMYFMCTDCQSCQIRSLSKQKKRTFFRPLSLSLKYALLPPIFLSRHLFF